MKWSALSREQQGALIRMVQANEPGAAKAFRLMLAAEYKARLEDDTVPGFNPAMVKRLAPGRAYGTGELQRKHSLAMPMQYFRHGGGC